jgi:hypothetical protein
MDGFQRGCRKQADEAVPAFRPELEAEDELCGRMSSLRQNLSVPPAKTSSHYECSRGGTLSRSGARSSEAGGGVDSRQYTRLQREGYDDRFDSSVYSFHRSTFGGSKDEHILVLASEQAMS